jgi:DNA-binding NarL/FixJ family response regulator
VQKINLFQYAVHKVQCGGIVKLLIVESSKAVHHRLIELLGGVETLTALSVARNLAELTERLEQLHPDTVVLDIDFPDGKSLHHIGAIREKLPNVCIYVFSNHSDCRERALNMGADAFYDKSLEFEQLIETLLAHMLRGQKIVQ